MKFFKEMDVVNLLRSVRTTKLLANSQLNRRQHILLKLQRKKVIESEEITS